jgi:hypothetical protein
MGAFFAFGVAPCAPPLWRHREQALIGHTSLFLQDPHVLSPRPAKRPRISNHPKDEIYCRNCRAGNPTRTGPGMARTAPKAEDCITPSGRRSMSSGSGRPPALARSFGAPKMHARHLWPPLYREPRPWTDLVAWPPGNRSFMYTPATRWPTATKLGPENGSIPRHTWAAGIFNRSWLIFPDVRPLCVRNEHSGTRIRSLRP